MHIKPQRNGDTLIWTIDLSILDQGTLTPDTEFSVSTDGHAIIITMVEDRDEIDNVEFAFIIERINERYGRALQRLAD